MSLSEEVLAARRQEEQLIAGLMRQPDMLHDASTAITVADFTFPPNALVYSAMLQAVGLGLTGGPGQAIDLGTLADVLVQRKEIEDAGGYQRLGQLWELAASGGNVPYLCKQIKGRSVVWHLHRVAQEIARDTANWVAFGGDPSGFVSEAEDKLFSVSNQAGDQGAVAMGSLVAQLMDRIDRQSQHGEPAGVTTGLLDLDSVLTTMRPSELIVLAARPSVGKSALAAQIAVSAAKRDVATFFASLEMSGEELVERVVVSESSIPGKKIRDAKLNEGEMSQLMVGIRRVSGLPVYIDAHTPQPVARIAMQARKIHQKRPLGLIVVDYLQLVEPESKREPRHEQIGGITRRLKSLAKDLRVPVLALSQLNRSADGDRPRLSHLRESGSIEADADVVLLMHRPDETSDIVEVDVAKHRNGPTGQAAILFRREYTRFESMYKYGV